MSKSVEGNGGMFRFLLFLLGWVLFIVVMTVLTHAGKTDLTSNDAEVIGTIEEIAESTLVDPAILDSISNAYQSSDYITALSLLDQHEKTFDHLSESQSDLAYLYYYLKGFVHSELWQYIEAEQSWQVAKGLTRDEEKQARLSELLKASRYMLDDLNDERHLKNLYHASPYVGPAARLQGKIAVMYIFLTDAAMQNWSVRKRDYVMQNWQIVENWLTRSSKDYASELSFSHRVFLVNKNPHIKRLRVGDFDKNYQHADKVAQLVAENFGFTSISQFISKIKQEEDADQAVLLLHLARDGRSFASRCMYRCKADGEFVFLMENANPKDWQSLGYAQAHETLHLFGADDLYNIELAEHYAVRDIMNYPSSFLEASTIEPITAYAIGLDVTRPKTPFRIKNYAPRGYNNR